MLAASKGFLFEMSKVGINLRDQEPVKPVKNNPTLQEVIKATEPKKYPPTEEQKIVENMKPKPYRL